MSQFFCHFFLFLFKDGSTYGHVWRRWDWEGQLYSSVCGGQSDPGAIWVWDSMNAGSRLPDGASVAR